MFNLGLPLVDLTKANALADELGDQDLVSFDRDFERFAGLSFERLV